MTQADKPKWVELRRALWPDCTRERHSIEIEQLLHSDGVVLLAEDGDGQAVGFAEISIRRDHVEGTSSTPVPYLEGWYVIPSCRGKGVGRILVESAAAWALHAGFSELASDAELNNTASIRAHAKLGFREVARTVHFVRALEPQTVEADSAG
jgi:aminoglycoside 6'-N-acetyltransferase I